MSRRVWTNCFLSASLAFAASLYAQPGTVHTLDGGTYSGDIVDRGQYISISSHGIETRIDKRNVAGNILYAASFDDQYTQRHAKLDAYDVKGREALADFCLQHSRPDLAVRVLTEAAAIAPTSREVALELQAAQKQAELDRSGGRSSARGRTPRGAASRPASSKATPAPVAAASTQPGSQSTSQPSASEATAAPPHRLLSLAEVNTLRQIELPADDTSVHVTFDHDVVARFAKSQNRDVRELRQMDPARLAQMILADGGPKLAPDVRIMTDPAPIVTFHKKVLPIIMAGCASAGCHGGTHAGSFGLYTGSSPNVVYTNFYILQTYAKSFNKVQYLAMDRNYPDRSLVLQLAIPANQAMVAHPAVDGYRPRMSGPNDPGYKTIFDWLSSLRPIEPQYGLNVSPSLPTTHPDK